jgi:glycosyltransferase involved in cell wall biosynthesis
MNKLLSIVIPVYKVEKYIDKCISSLIVPDEKQLHQLDIVVINDGTPDNSAVLARQWEKKYPDIIRVIDQENRGHGGAWNHGTELAVGKYLFYLDSDDWFDTEQFSKLITFLGHCDTDMVLLDRKKYYAQEDRYEDVILVNMEPDKVYDANTYDWLGSGNGSNITYAHNSVYRTAMMQKYLPLFCEHVMYDDVSLQVVPIAIAESFVYTKLNVYRYYIGRVGQSFDPQVRAKHGDHVTTVLKFVLAWMNQHRADVPVNTTRRDWFNDLWWAFGSCHYEELSLFPYKMAQPRLKEWDEYMLKEFPDVKVSGIVKDYRRLPFPLYWIKFKVGRQFNRVKKYIKRKVK